MLIERLRKGTPVFKTNSDGLMDIVEWQPPTRIMLQAANKLERNELVINGFINALQTAEWMFADQREVILRQNLIIQGLQAQMNKENS